MDGLVLDGCPTLTREQHEAVAAAIAGADPFDEHVWSKDRQPAIISWDEGFERVIESRRGVLHDYTRKGICPYPWAIFEAIPKPRKLSSILYWNQGNRPSCSMHAAVHATEAATLTEMLLGAPLIYDALNPIYPFYLAKGGSLNGGLTIYDTAEQINKGGLVSVSEVGSDNISAPSDARDYAEESAKRQTAVVYIDRDYTDRIFRAAAAGFYVVFGSYLIYTGSKTDSNGVKVGGRTTRGGHAQSFGSWRKKGNTEYVFLTNSHGEIYTGGTEGDPETGCWVTRGQVDDIAESFAQFGPPFVVLPESPTQTAPRLIIDFDPKFPKGWNTGRAGQC